MEDSLYPQPTPSVLYIYDDLTDKVCQSHSLDSPILELTQQLMNLLRRDSRRVVILTFNYLMDSLRSRTEQKPFATTVAIGTSGERVARQLHEHTGWFPAIHRLDFNRQEDGSGSYAVVSSTKVSITDQVKLLDLEMSPTVAVVDDFIFSGVTMLTVLQAMPTKTLPHIQIFCLGCVAESLPIITASCPVHSGLTAEGRMLEEVSIINASELVLTGGIKRHNQRPMAFFERPQWMRAWFPGYAVEMMRLCRRLNSLLQPAHQVGTKVVLKSNAGRRGKGQQGY